VRSFSPVIVRLSRFASPGGWLTPALALLLFGHLTCAAAPVTDSAVADPSAATAQHLIGGPTARESSAVESGSRRIDGSGRRRAGDSTAATAGMSTGNKNLDLLLDMQGNNAMQQPAAGAQSEAAVLRAAEEAKAARARLQALGHSPAAANGLPLLAADPLRAQTPPAAPGAMPERAPQREWIPPPAGGAGGSALGGALSGLTSGGGGSSNAGEDRPRRFDPDLYQSDEDNLLRMLPADVRAFLRDNRYTLLAGAVLVALVAGIGMLYRRRV